MQSNFKIEILTPTHIGSGNDLLGNYGYLNFKDESKLAVLDDKKVLEILGQENIAQWVSALDSGESIFSLLQRRKKELTASDIALRVMDIASSAPEDTNNRILKEQLFTLKRPLLPGSSIKGAFRTGMLRLYIDEDKHKTFFGEERNLKNRKNKFNDGLLISRYLGRDPNHDIFRMLSVGDVHFSDTTTCHLAQTVNEVKEEVWSLKRDANQYVECLPVGATANFRIQYKELLEKIASSTYVSRRERNGDTERYKLFGTKKISDLRPENLFKFLNQHITFLLEDELDFWDKQNSYPEQIANYKEHLEAMLKKTKAYAEAKETQKCVVRLGWGTGFRNLTGDWQQDVLSAKLYERLIRDLRKTHPTDIPYPKTRRLTEEGLPFGFVEISKI